MGCAASRPADATNQSVASSTAATRSSNRNVSQGSGGQPRNTDAQVEHNRTVAERQVKIDNGLIVSKRRHTAIRTSGVAIQGAGTPTCEHLSMMYLMTKREDRGRLLDGMRDPGFLGDQIEYMNGLEFLENQYEHAIKTDPTAKHVFHKDDLGKYLSSLVNALGSLPETTSASDPRSANCLILTAEHLMGVSIVEKEKEQKYWAITFFDPNATNTHKRMVLTDPNSRTLTDLTRRDMVAKPSHDKYHGQSTTAICLNSSVEANFTRDFSNKSWTELQDHMHLALASGSNLDVEAIIDVCDDMPNTQESQRAKNNILHAMRVDRQRDTSGISGLHKALSSGHIDVIRTFGEAVKNFPVEERISPLDAREDRSTLEPGLYIAFRYGHAGTISAYAEALDGLPQDETVRLLEARNKEGTTGLQKAMINGHYEALSAFGNAIVDFEPNIKFELLKAQSSNEPPGLHAALYYGHAKAIDAFAATTDGLSDDAKAYLICAGRTPLEVLNFCNAARSNEHEDAADAFEELVMSTDSNSLQWLQDAFSSQNELASV